MQLTALVVEYYLGSTGTGAEDGEGHERVRQAAVRYVRLADQYVEASRLVTDPRYPDADKVYYYLLTYDGVRLCVGDKSRIDNGTDPTLPFFMAAQDVLAELRLVAGIK